MDLILAVKPNKLNIIGTIALLAMDLISWFASMFETNSRPQSNNFVNFSNFSRFNEANCFPAGQTAFYNYQLTPTL